MKMSGSKDRRNKVGQTDGFDLKNDKDMQADLKRQKQTRTAVITLLIFAVVAVAVLVVNSNFFYRNMTAVNVDGERFSISEMNYYVRHAWTIEGALELATNNAILHQRAVEEGLSLTEAQLANIEAQIESYREQYAMAGFDTLNGLLSARYGRGVNARVVRERLTFDALAHAYIVHFIESAQDEFTEAELEAHYLEEADNFDRIVFRSHSFAVVPSDATPEVEAELASLGAMPVTVAQAAAEAILEAALEDGEEGFLRAVTPYMNEEWDQDADSTTMRDHTVGSLEALSYGDWLRMATRRPGDVVIHTEDSAITVLYFVERDDNRQNTVGVRHILISPEVVEIDGVPTQDWDGAQERAEEILAQWRGEGATEERFIELAQAYSADYRGEEDPGFYGGLHRNSEFVEPFRSWAIDASRRPGDTGIVETQFGFHIMFFVGEETERSLRHQIAAESLAIENYHTWLEERLEAANVQRTFLGRLVDGSVSW